MQNEELVNEIENQGDEKGFEDFLNSITYDEAQKEAVTKESNQSANTSNIDKVAKQKAEEFQKSQEANSATQQVETQPAKQSPQKTAQTEARPTENDDVEIARAVLVNEIKTRTEEFKHNHPEVSPEVVAMLGKTYVEYVMQTGKLQGKSFEETYNAIYPEREQSAIKARYKFEQEKRNKQRTLEETKQQGEQLKPRSIEEVVEAMIK